MSDDNPICLTCGERHADADRTDGCPTMAAAQASDARPGNVPLDVYTGYLSARGALLAHSPRAAIKGLQRILSSMAEAQGARPDAGFSEKLDKLRNKGVIGARIRSTLLKEALSDAAEETQAWALMSIAEHAFYRLYLGKGTSP